MTCGAIYLNSGKIDVKREENIAFDCVAQANSLRMGIVLGGNVHEYTYKLFENSLTNRAILFELLDTPLDITAEALFAPEGVLVNGEKGDVPEILSARLNKVQTFISSIFHNPVVEKIILVTNYDNDLYDLDKAVKISEVASTIMNVYAEGDVFAPTIRLCITA